MIIATGDSASESAPRDTKFGARTTLDTRFVEHGASGADVPLALHVGLAEVSSIIGGKAETFTAPVAVTATLERAAEGNIAPGVCTGRYTTVFRPWWIECSFGMGGREEKFAVCADGSGHSLYTTNPMKVCR